jgi:hypothetical protein
MISFYKVEINATVQVIGCFPQVKLLPTENWEYWGETSVTGIPLEGIIPFRPQFPRFGLESHAKVTDLMSSVILGSKLLMISQKLYSTFAMGFMDVHQCFTEYLETPNGKIPYLIIYLNNQRENEVLDWGNCILFDQNDLEKNPITVSDSKGFRTAANGKVLRPERLVLRKDQPLFDVFSFRYFIDGRGFFISAEMKKLIESAGISGIRFEQFECLEQKDL